MPSIPIIFVPAFNDMVFLSHVLLEFAYIQADTLPFKSCGPQYIYIFFLLSSLLCTPSMLLFDQNYNKIIIFEEL